MSGLVVEKSFANTLVLEFFSSGMYRQRDAIRAALDTHFPGSQYYWFAEEHVQKQESFDLRAPEPPPPGEITEHGLRFRVAPGGKHKTGFLDQRHNRRRFADLCGGKRVLDLCSTRAASPCTRRRLAGRRKRLAWTSTSPYSAWPKQNGPMQ